MNGREISAVTSLFQSVVISNSMWYDPLPNTPKQVEDGAQTELSWRVKGSAYSPLKSTPIIRHMHFHFNTQVESNCVHAVDIVLLWFL